VKVFIVILSAMLFLFVFMCCYFFFRSNFNRQQAAGGSSFHICAMCVKSHTNNNFFLFRERNEMKRISFHLLSLIVTYRHCLSKGRTLFHDFFFLKFSLTYSHSRIISFSFTNRNISNP
jgi:hypothetical protein